MEKITKSAAPTRTHAHEPDSADPQCDDPLNVAPPCEDAHPPEESGDTAQAQPTPLGELLPPTSITAPAPAARAGRKRAPLTDERRAAAVANLTKARDARFRNLADRWDERALEALRKGAANSKELADRANTFRARMSTHVAAPAEGPGSGSETEVEEVVEVRKLPPKPKPKKKKKRIVRRIVYEPATPDSSGGEEEEEEVVIEGAGAGGHALPWARPIFV